MYRVDLSIIEYALIVVLVEVDTERAQRLFDTIKTLPGQSIADIAERDLDVRKQLLAKLNALQTLRMEEIGQ